MRRCTRAELTCILPPGVAVNSAGKLRLIWDGRHLNRHLPRYKFRMEPLQSEGRALFERSAWGGTADLSSAYHHIEIHGDSTGYLSFEWQGEFFYFAVLPFGISTAPWLFTTVMGHCGRFLRSPGLGLDLLLYLHDRVLAAATAAGSLSAARTLLNTLRNIGWLVDEAECTGTSEALQIFTALGTAVDLATQVYRVPAATVARILDAAQRLATGPPAAPVRTVARLKGLITATWGALRAATRVRTRALDSVIELRPLAPPTSAPSAGLCPGVPGGPGRGPVVDRVPPRSQLERALSSSRSTPVPQASTRRSTATSRATLVTPASGRSSALPLARPPALLPCSALCATAPLSG